LGDISNFNSSSGFAEFEFDKFDSLWLEENHPPRSNPFALALVLEPG
jgi:hypothetical protein